MSFSPPKSIRALIALALVALPTPTLAQIGRPGPAQLERRLQERFSNIQGKVTDEQGEPVAAATLEVTRVSPQSVSTGGWHRLDVRVRGRGLTVQARPGYLSEE